MPALSAQYVSLVARACPGLFTEHFIRYHLPQERGWSYIHAWQLEQGHQTIWPDRRNPAVAWWEKIKARFVKNALHELPPPCGSECNQDANGG